MIKAVFFDYFGVLNVGDELNQEITEFIKINNGRYLFAILSAMQGDLRDWLVGHSINDYFALVQTTGMLGIKKEEPMFYQNALNVLNIKADQAIFVDDNPRYIQIARKLGIVGLHYDSQKNFKEQVGPLL